MRKAIGQDELEQIEDDSYSLLNYRNLPSLATPSQQVEALRRDKGWQEDHQIEVSRRIDRVIKNIEEGGENE